LLHLPFPLKKPRFEIPIITPKVKTSLNGDTDSHRGFTIGDDKFASVECVWRERRRQLFNLLPSLLFNKGK
jgi:hypothetical protein